jgi:hypothetical protein
MVLGPAWVASTPTVEPASRLEKEGPDVTAPEVVDRFFDLQQLPKLYGPCHPE